MKTWSLRKASTNPVQRINLRQRWVGPEGLSHERFLLIPTDNLAVAPKQSWQKKAKSNLFLYVFKLLQPWKNKNTYCIFFHPSYRFHLCHHHGFDLFTAQCVPLPFFLRGYGFLWLRDPTNPHSSLHLGASCVRGIPDLPFLSGVSDETTICWPRWSHILILSFPTWLAGTVIASEILQFSNRKLYQHRPQIARKGIRDFLQFVSSRFTRYIFFRRYISCKKQTKIQI